MNGVRPGDTSLVMSTLPASGGAGGGCTRVVGGAVHGADPCGTPWYGSGCTTALVLPCLWCLVCGVGCGFCHFREKPALNAVRNDTFCKTAKNSENSGVTGGATVVSFWCH